MTTEEMEKIVTVGIDTARKNLTERDRIQAFVSEFAKVAEKKLSAEIGERVDVCQDQPIKSLSACVAQLVQFDPRPLPNSFELSAGFENAAPTQRVPILKYEMDPYDCYPCYVQWGGKDVACMSYSAVERAVGIAWKEQGTSVLGALKERIR